MDAPLDLSRWRDNPLGLAHRRWAIISVGLRQLLRTRFFRLLVLFAWSGGFALAVVGFLFTQSVATGGWLESFAAGQGPRVQAIASAFTALVLLYPDICIGGVFSLLFSTQASLGMLLSLLALSSLVPNLITRDRASSALTIYLSRPLTSLDYLTGKLGIILGVLVLVWTGPLLFGWGLSMLIAPSGEFIVYSLGPLGRALLVNVLSLVTLASVALAVSSLTRSSRGTVFLWIGVWALALSVAGFPTTPDWLRAASFHYDLEIVSDAIFGLERLLSDAASTLPLMSRDINTQLERMAEASRVDNLHTAWTGLAVLVCASLVVLFRRIRPE